MKRQIISIAVDTESRKFPKMDYTVTPARKTRVKFSAEVTVILIPYVEEKENTMLWWSAGEILYFRRRRRIMSNMLNQISSMALVVTNDASRRPLLASMICGDGSLPTNKYVACDHLQLKRALEIMDHGFHSVIIDGADAKDFCNSLELVNKLHPTTSITVYNGDGDQISKLFLQF